MRRRFLRRAPFVVAALLLGLGGAFLLLRDSSMFAVDRVDVRGASGPDAPRIEAALRDAARTRTTLNVKADELRQAARAYPTVKDVRIARDLPGGLTLTVIERRPVAVVERSGRRIPLAADGRLLQGATPPENLPSLDLREVPAARVTDPRGRQLVALVAAAPGALRSRAELARLGDKGLTLEMDRGPELYFGDAKDLPTKWRAVARVLADPSAEGATYIDVSVPGRAVAGGLAPLEAQDPFQEAPANGLLSPSTGA